MSVNKSVLGKAWIPGWLLGSWESVVLLRSRLLGICVSLYFIDSYVAVSLNCAV